MQYEEPITNPNVWVSSELGSVPIEAMETRLLDKTIRALRRVRPLLDQFNKLPLLENELEKRNEREA
jgi:hypothetical protein